MHRRGIGTFNFNLNLYVFKYHKHFAWHINATKTGEKIFNNVCIYLQVDYKLFLRYDCLPFIHSLLRVLYVCGVYLCILNENI